MLYLTASKINLSEEMPFDPTAALVSVGCALVAGSVIGTVKPSAGAAGEVFVGASLAQPLTLLDFPKVETLTVAADGSITLAQTPIGGTLVVWDTANANAKIATTSVTGNVAKVDSVANANKSVTVTYRFSPTALQARALQGDVQPGNAASITSGTVGVVRIGTIYTSCYDTTVDWTAANAVVRVGANGLFTTAGTGTVVPNAQVVAAPAAGGSVASTNGLLGLRFSA